MGDLATGRIVVALYVISYDQHRDKDYTPLWNKLAQLGAVRVLESVWLLDLQQTAVALRDILKGVTKNEDSLLVIQVFTNSAWATLQVQTAGSNWLESHIP